MDSLAISGMPTVGYTGMVLPLQVQALDSTGTGVEGAAVELEVTQGAPILSVTSVVTDSAGRASVEVSLAEAGGVALALTVRGTAVTRHWWTDVLPRPRVQYESDSVHLAGVGCRSSLFAQVLDDQGQLILASSVSFEATNPEVVSFFSMSSYTGNYRGMYAGLAAETPGRTSVVARHASGAADTAVVEVAADSVSEVQIAEAAAFADPELSPYQTMEATPLLGDTLHWGLWAGNPCGRRIEGVAVDWESTAPHVASVDEEGVVVAHNHGQARIVAAGAGLADTALVATLEVLPRDSTITVGDTVRFTMSYADADGELHPVDNLWVQAFGGEAEERAAATILEDGEPTDRVVGVRPGTARIWLTGSFPEGLTGARAFVNLQVVER